MELIERYLHAIGHHLPAKSRADILAELRSTLEDSLESSAGASPTEAQAADAIRKMGPPQKVAAAYHPEQQYLIGPELFPLFRMVLGIVLAAVVGAQIIAVVVSILLSSEPVAFLEAFWGILDSVPAALGSIVVVFYILQRFDVRPDEEEKEFDPYSLPAVDAGDRIKRGEHFVSIVAGVLFFIVLTWFSNQGAFGWSQVNGFFMNPVLEQYFPWIALSLLAGILMDVLLLWRGRWEIWTRAGHVLVNLFSLGVLYQLIRAHDAWLQAAGYQGSYFGLTELPDLVNNGTELIGMLGFRIGLAVAAVVTVIETVVLLARLLLSLLRSAGSSRAATPA